MSDRFAVLPQYLLPKQAVTTLAGKLASAQAGGLTTSFIRWFVGRYGVDMGEAANPDIAGYASFNEFFTRPLRAGARPLAPADFICPVDGAISQFGAIERDQIFQAKGHHYSTTALVGGDAELAGERGQGLFGEQVLRQDCETIGHDGYLGNCCDPDCPVPGAQRMMPPPRQTRLS